MIISKTPLRISLFGGGSDFPSYYKKKKSSVIGFAINRYNYIFFNSKFINRSVYKYQISYSKFEKINQIQKIKHPSVRETLKYFNFDDPFQLHFNGELPARTGLGSSSAFTVGLCNILNYLKNKKINMIGLAKQAIDIEQNKIKEFVGSQDQTFASFGGFNKISFYKKNINVKKLKLSKSQINEIEESSLLVFTGQSRFADKIEKKKFNSMNNKKMETLNEIVSISSEAEKLFSKKKIDITEVGKLLNDSWKLKKTLDQQVSNDRINDIYNYAIESGAYGGKLLGAGGGGFIYLLCPKHKKNKIKRNLKKLVSLDIKISEVGSKIISATPEYY